MKITKYIDNKIEECINSTDEWITIQSIGRISIAARKTYGKFTINIYNDKCDDYKILPENIVKWWQFKTPEVKYYVDITTTNGIGWSPTTYKEFNTNDIRFDNIFEILTERNEKKYYMKYLSDNDKKDYEHESKQYEREKKLKRILKPKNE